MGNRKQKWTSEEEEALKAGVAKHGTGNWKSIQRDPEFHRYLSLRSNIDLKDKWRNMIVSTGERSRNSKAKNNNNNKAIVVASSSETVIPGFGNLLVDNSPKVQTDSKAIPGNELIFEAISTLDKQNGIDTNAIFGYIENQTMQKKQTLPPNFRRTLTTRLRRLITQEKLIKVGNCYKIKETHLLSGTIHGTSQPMAESKDTRPKQIASKTSSSKDNSIDEAAAAAAAAMVEAEELKHKAIKALKDVENLENWLEVAQNNLKLAEDIYAKLMQGEDILQAFDGPQGETIKQGESIVQCENIGQGLSIKQVPNISQGENGGLGENIGQAMNVEHGPNVTQGENSGLGRNIGQVMDVELGGNVDKGENVGQAMNVEPQGENVGQGGNVDQGENVERGENVGRAMNMDSQSENVGQGLNNAQDVNVAASENVAASASQ